MRNKVLFTLLVFLMTSVNGLAQDKVESYRTFSHTYKVGEHILVKNAGLYEDATIKEIDSRGYAKLVYYNKLANDSEGGEYTALGAFSTKPFNPVSSYKPWYSDHVFKLGDRVVGLGGTNTPGTITAINSDGLIRVQLDRTPYDLLGVFDYTYAETASWEDGLFGDGLRSYGTPQASNRQTSGIPIELTTAQKVKMAVSAATSAIP